MSQFSCQRFIWTLLYFCYQCQENVFRDGHFFDYLFFVFFLVFGLTRLFVPWKFSTNRPTSSSVTYNSAAAETAGTWTVGPSTSAVAIHATLLYTGKIFYLTGSGYNLANQFGPYIAKVFDPSNGTESTVSLTEDLFCAGNTQLSNGNILLAGGTKMYDIAPDSCNGYWHGLNVAYEFDVQSSSLNKVSSMKQARWYPTCLLLPDKRVFVTGGMDDHAEK